MTSDPQTVTYAEFGRRTGRTRQAVADLVKRGKLTAIGGRIHLALGMAELERVRSKVPTAHEGDTPAGVGPGNTYADSRAQSAFYAAQMARLDYERLVGGLLVRGEVEGAFTDAIITIRSEVESWSLTMPPRLAALGADERAIGALLRAEIDRLLTRVAQKFERQALEAAEAPQQ